MDTPDALSAAGTGMRVQADTLDVIASNLANVSTAGFRERHLAFTTFDRALSAQIGLSGAQGTLRHTGVSTDCALSGRGYFAVATSDGVRYTRDGRFARDPHNHLVDAYGNAVLGSLGPVRFPPGATIDERGHVSVGRTIVDRLRIVDFDQPCDVNSISQAGFGAPPGAVPKRATATVHAQYIEESGVEAVSQMSALISAERAYEANEKSASRADESLRRVVTDLPVVRS